MESLRQKLNKIPKKGWVAIAISLAVVVICTVLTVVFMRQKPNQAALVAEIPTETVTQSTSESTPEETTTVPESTSETTTKAPKKPVGTTAPVEREEPALPAKIEKPKPPVMPKKLLNVPFIDQRQKYPTGCESVAAVMAMQYYGMSITPEQFIDKYLDKGVTPYRDANGDLFGDDPRKVFLGNPYSKKGWGCWAPVIVNGVNKCIDQKKFAVRAVYGKSIDELCKTYIDNDIPVLIWATQNMASAENGKTWYITGTAETFTWIRPMHCLLLVGYDNGGYYFNDSLQAKNFRYEKAEVSAAYNALHCQAVVIAPKPPEETATEERTTDAAPESSTGGEQTEISEEQTTDTTLTVTSTVPQNVPGA